MDLEIIKVVPDTARTKRAILFLHGMWHGAWIWQYNFMPYFACHGHPCYALSFRGHGKSYVPEHEPGISDFVIDLEDTVRALGNDPIIIAHSMGGFVLQQ